MKKRFCEWRISGVAWARNWSGEQWPPLKGKGNPSHFGLASKQKPSFVEKSGVGPWDTDLIHAAAAAPIVPFLPYFWYLQVEKINKNKLCLPMNPRAVLTIKGLKKGAVILHHCKAENVVVRSRECCSESKVSIITQAGSLFGISQTSPLTFTQER